MLPLIMKNTITHIYRANEKIKKIYRYICGMFHNKVRQSNKDVTYGNICVPADLGEENDGYITHIHIGKAKE